MNKNKKTEYRRQNTEFCFLITVFCILVFLCWFVGHNFSSPPTPDLGIGNRGSGIESQGTSSEGRKTRDEAGATSPIARTEAPESPATPLRRVKTACELIYQGKFEAAGELIKQDDANNPAELSTIVRQLTEIIGEYQALSQRRQSARQAAYQQQLAELEKFETRNSKPVPSEVEGFEISAEGRPDANDANDLTEALSIIAKASEFANDAQRYELLRAPFVKQIFQKTIDKAAEFELKGKWLDAYTSCYAWLQAIDPNNQAYSDYADQLLDKAAIVATFADSPCETLEERFQGIKEQMFIRAIDALDSHYVSTIDYSQMAGEAIRRCQLLGEVIEVQQRSGVSGQVSELDPNSEPRTLKPELPTDPNKLAAWSAALTTLANEVDGSPTGETKDKFIEVFQKVLTLNAATLELSRPILIAQFAEAAFLALDPYTVMVWPRQVQDFEKMMTNEFTGIGIEISKQKGLLTVSSLLPDTPAYKAGLDAEDVIVAVDGVETKDMSLICAVHKITGPEGTKVTLTIKRAGEEKTRDITITRAKITVPTIRGWQRAEAGKWLYMVDESNSIGYVRITSFSSDTPSALEKVLSQLEQEGLKGLILDLRFNSGGLLESAVDVADKFVEEGLIVRTQPGFGRTPTYKPAHKEGTHPNFPLVILINAGSASGAEIVAGALADEQHKRAILAGQRTHGKGLVQGIMQFSTGAQLKYTMAYYHLPSGQRVKSQEAAEKAGTKDWGIGPNIEIELTNDELRKMINVQRDNEVLVQADRSQGRQSPQRHTLEETLAADPELAVAVLVVKTKLAQERVQKTEDRMQKTED